MLRVSANGVCVCVCVCVCNIYAVQQDTESDFNE